MKDWLPELSPDQKRFLESKTQFVYCGRRRDLHGWWLRTALLATQSKVMVLSARETPEDLAKRLSAYGWKATAKGEEVTGTLPTLGQEFKLICKTVAKPPDNP
ncbi:MAG TPA: hypothetical protein VFU31_19315 [Candidatus Binatia bacterium]|nr:hypothetical protein [Candidatus Binatia bacterium]